MRILVLILLSMFVFSSCSTQRTTSNPSVPVSEKIRLCVKDFVEYSGIEPELAAAVCNDIYRR